MIDSKIKKGLKLTNYKFEKKPLVVGGLAMEYHGLRKTVHDYDYIVSKKDWNKFSSSFINSFSGISSHKKGFMLEMLFHSRLCIRKITHN